MESATADLVLLDAAVYTVDAARRWAQAVAVRDGRIIAVGTDQQVGALIGPQTQVLQCEGRMVLPGFQDSHCHPPASGRDLRRCYLGNASDRESALAVIKEYAASHPDEQWIRGGGWSMEFFDRGTPSAEELDAVIPDRPVFLTNRDGHGGWVNSKALELGHIDKDTPDPDDGRIERLADGTPQGTLHEGAMDLIEKVLPATTLEELREGLRLAQRHLHSLGITAWQDAIVGDDYWGDSLGLYTEMGKSGELTARVVGALWWERTRGAEQIPEKIEARRSAEDAGRFRATSVKIMQDGVLENFTGAVLEPYVDADGSGPKGEGLSYVDPEALKGYVTELDREGFQVHFHAIGDRAVRECLDAVEAARKANGLNDNRHHISHIQMIHPDDIPRFRALGVVANAQPYWACLEPQMRDLTIPFLGPERAQLQYQFESLRRSGAQLAFGSDWDVSTANPLEEMEVAVNRIDPDHRDHEVFIPDERIDLPTALDAFTIGAAFVNHLDHETGSVEAGKFADLAVLDRNLFASDAGPIADAKVVRTFVEGEAVYTDESISLGE